VLQCVAVCCSVLQCVAVCCSVLQCAAISRILRASYLWFVHLCVMLHWYAWHDSFIYVTRNACIRVVRLLHTCDTTHAYVWYDAFIRVIWLVHTCDMNHTYVWYGAFVRVIWLMHTCDMTHACMCHAHLCGTSIIKWRWAPVLQRGVCCSVLQCVAVCYSVCSSVFCSVLQRDL